MDKARGTTGERRWRLGETLIARNIARSDGSVTMALPTIVIRDDGEVLALHVPAGTVAQDNYVVPAEKRAATVAATAPSGRRAFVERVWRTSSIRLYLPGEAFSVWLFFDSDGAFTGWYGNLETPFVRTAIGIDVRDHGLDVVADPKGRWRWKDEAEFAARLAAGIDTPEHQAAVRRAGQAFIDRLERCAAPFDQGWPQWRAPSDWRPRALPDGWAADLGTSSRL